MRRHRGRTVARVFGLATASRIASGEGEGGRPGDEDSILDYYRSQSLEMVGHSAAFELSCARRHLAGGNQAPDGRGRLTRALEWTGAFCRAVDGTPFPLAREVPTLIVRNNALQRSNRNGRDYGNVLGLLGFLGQPHVEVGSAMDEDLSCGAVPRTVDLAPYRVVFLPCVECGYAGAAWRALDAWLSGPVHRGRRSLVVGFAGQRTPCLALTGAFHPALARLCETCFWPGVSRGPSRRPGTCAWRAALTRRSSSWGSGSECRLGTSAPWPCPRALPATGARPSACRMGEPSCGGRCRRTGGSSPNESGCERRGPRP